MEIFFWGAKYDRNLVHEFFVTGRPLRKLDKVVIGLDTWIEAQLQPSPSGI